MFSKSNQNRISVTNSAIQFQILIKYSAHLFKDASKELAGNPANVAKALCVGLEELKNRNPDRAKILLHNVFVETGLNEQEFLDHLNITEIMLS